MTAVCASYDRRVLDTGPVTSRAADRRRCTWTQGGTGGALRTSGGRGRSAVVTPVVDVRGGEGRTRLLGTAIMDYHDPLTLDVVATRRVD